MRVSFKESHNLNGDPVNVVHKVGDGSIIKLFESTPSPQKPDDVVCPHFLELKWANGCYFDCAWCFLNGTYRFHPEWKNGRPRIKDLSKVGAHLEAFLTNGGTAPSILNAGELSDSLMAEAGRRSEPPFSEFIINTMNTHDPKHRHRVLFLTKSASIENLIRLSEEGRKTIIMSFTLNADAVAKTWEKRAPPVKARIEAAKRVQEAGYTTRVRIDPIVPIQDWQKHYATLVEEVFSSLRPDRITLGSLRGLGSTIANAKDKSWTAFLSEKSSWGRKVQLAVRREIYMSVMKQLKGTYAYKNVALCKETLELWRSLGLNYKQVRCNCVP